MKYGTLRAFLSRQTSARLKMSFDEVTAAAKVKLPASAFRYPQWWENDPAHHVQAKAWLDAGYRTERLDLNARTVEFARLEVARGVREMSYTFDQEPKRAAVHPAYGALKGTFTIDPDCDLTKPALDEDELAEMDANLDRLADRVEEGVRRHKK